MVNMHQYSILVGCTCTSFNNGKGPSIYDVHTKGARGSGSGGRMWMGEGVNPHVDVHTENYN